MSLKDRAVLEIDLDVDGTEVTGVFELREDLEESGEVNKQFLMSNRGQYINEAYDIGTDLLPDEVADADIEDRRGYHVDGGAGQYSQNLSFKVNSSGSTTEQWGDGSSDPTDEDDVTKYDATGSYAKAQKQVLEWYVAQSRTDSRRPARLHVGEWTDGSHSSSAGVFGEPLMMAIHEASVTFDPNEPNTIEGTLEVTWTSLFPDVDLEGAFNDGLDAIADYVPDA